MGVDGDNFTALHRAAYKGHVDVLKALLQSYADVNAIPVPVNAITEEKHTALRFTVSRGDIHCTLLLLCCGAEIDEVSIKKDKTKLLRPIETKLKLLRSGNRMGIALMSDEERRFMWNLAFCFTIKQRVAAFKAYYAIRSFITFHGIFMGPGYDLGDGSVWNRKSK